MASLMSKHFKWYGYVIKACGLLFIRNIGSKNEQDIKVTCRSLYLIYSVCCFALFVLPQVSMFKQASLTVLTEVKTFTRSLHIVLFGLVTFKVLLNVSSIAINSCHLVDFLKESALYEKLVHFNPPKNCRQATICYVSRFLLFLAFIANVCICCYLEFDFIHTFSYRGAIDTLFKAVCILSNFLLFVYEMVHFVALRPCAEVLRLYIQHQHDTLRRVLQIGTKLTSATREEEIERVRMNICTIKRLGDRLNRVWRWCITASAVTVLCILCISIYLAFAQDAPTPHRLLAMTYGLSSSIDFADIAALSQAMVGELNSIRQTLHEAPTSSENVAYFHQVSYLRDSIRPKQIALSGADFFSLDLPLLVSLAGSVITYSVILVQTSESVNGVS